MWIALILLGLGAGFYVYKRVTRPKWVPPPPRSISGVGLGMGMGTPEYHEVPKVQPAPREMGRMLQPGEICCKAARSVSCIWYPDTDAPKVPLITCDQPQICKCLWQRVLDRRQEHRRIHHDRRTSVRFEDRTDRRAGRDRRKDAGDNWKES
jgi:hypothetical protein